MKHLRIKSLIVAIFLCVNLFASIKPDSKIDKLNVKNGILCLKNSEESKKLIDKLDKMSGEELIVFEDLNGYRSLAGLLYLSEMEDEYYYNSFFEKGLSLETLVSMIKNGEINEYSDFTLELISKGTLVEYNSKAGETLDLGLKTSNSLKLINEDGIVAIGKLIYKYTESNTYIITDGDFSKLQELKGANAKGAPSPVGSVIAVGHKSLKSGEDYNCQTQGCVSLTSNLQINKYWYLSDATGFKSQFDYYLENASYKFNLLKWRRQDYRVKFTGKINWNVNTGFCDYSFKAWGTTYTVFEEHIGDYYSFHQDISTLNTGTGACYISGYGDTKKFNIMQDNYLIIELEPTGNGESNHPTIRMILPSNYNSIDDLEMDF